MDNRRMRTIKKLRAAEDEIKGQGAMLADGEIKKIIAQKILHQRRSSALPGKRASYRKIADELNAAGRLTRAGKIWTPEDVYNVVNKRSGG